MGRTSDSDFNFPFFLQLENVIRNVLLLSPAGAVGPGTGDIATPPVRLSVRPSRLVFVL